VINRPNLNEFLILGRYDILNYMNIAQKTDNYFRRNIFNIIFVILFLGFFFALHWNSFNTPFERDEGEYAYSAWLIQQDKPFYVDSFVQKPPLIIYTYYLAHLVKPFALWPPRLLGFLFTLASCLLLSLISRKLYGKSAAWLTLFISPLLFCFPPLCALASNTEKFMLLPLIGLLALFVFKRDQENNFIYFLAGALSALAVLYKPFALPAASVLIIYWLGSDNLVERIWKKTLTSLLYIILGASVVTLLTFIYPILNGAMGEFWRQVIIYNFSYAADMKKYFPDQFFHYSGIFWTNLWPLFLLILVGIFFKPKYYGLWLGLLLASLLSIISTPIGHYYILLTPFLVLLAAGSYSQISEKIKFIEEEWRGCLLFIFIVFVMIVSFSSLGEQFLLSPRELSTWIYGRENPFVESSLMADKIKEITSSSDKIFVAGSEPQIYYYSQREAASKFDITYPLNILTPWREEYQNKVVSDLKQNKPAVIIVSLKSASGLWEQSSPYIFVNYLQSELKNNYVLIGGTTLDIGDNPVWLEGISLNDQADVSLLLYKRK